MILNDNPETEEKIATLIGVVSWGAACGYAEYPDVYSNVMNVLNWIKDKIGWFFVAYFCLSSGI